jgi:predicted nucleotidyltransferase
MNRDLLSQSILRTLAFFAAQGQAATLLEIRNYLFRVSPDQRKPDLGEIERALLGPLSGQVRHERGLFILTGQEAAIYGRADKYNRTLRLFKKARRWASGLRFVPYVRAVAISGSAALGNVSPDSDIDLLILVEDKRIFLARFLVSAYFQIFGGRRHGKNIVGRFCLNHYVVCGKRLQEDRNLYTAAEYSGLIPIFGQDRIRQFQRANLDWMGEYLVRSDPASTNFFDYAESRSVSPQIFLEKILFPLSALLERLLKAYQMQRIIPGRFILVSDDELSFHPDSKGQSILARYREILAGVEGKMS